jgi:hypothetical protein
MQEKDGRQDSSPASPEIDDAKYGRNSRRKSRKIQKTSPEDAGSWDRSGRAGSLASRFEQNGIGAAS